MRSIRPASLALSLSLSLLLPAVAEAGLDHDRKLDDSAEVYRELLASGDRAAPRKLLQDSRCVAVVPRVLKGALGWGGRHGRGVLTCRSGSGEWSPPIFVKLTGGSFGFQIGAQASDLVIFFMNQRGVRSLLESRFTLGVDASVAAGPVGRTAEAGTDAKFSAEIYVYARSRGFFAGISLEGARLAPDRKAIRRYYGADLRPDAILFDHRPASVPASATRFLAVLP